MDFNSRGIFILHIERKEHYNLNACDVGVLEEHHCGLLGVKLIEYKDLKSY